MTRSRTEQEGEIIDLYLEETAALLDLNPAQRADLQRRFANLACMVSSPVVDAASRLQHSAQRVRDGWQQRGITPDSGPVSQSGLDEAFEETKR